MDDTKRRGHSFIDDELDYDLGLIEPDAVKAKERTGAFTLPRRKGPYRPARLNVDPNWSRLATAGLAGLVVLFILIFAVRSYMHHRTVSAYENYLTEVKSITDRSNAEGQELRDLLSQPTGSAHGSVTQQLAKLTAKSIAVSTAAQKITPPDSMTESHKFLVMTMQYRSSGLSAFQRSVTAALSSSNKRAAAINVAQASQRLRAADVIYMDSFLVAARAVLAEDDVTGLSVPESDLIADPEFESAKNIELMLARLATSGGTAAKADGKKIPAKDGKIHGDGLQKVTMSPSGQELSSTTTTEVKGQGNTAFEVVVQNQGEGQEAQIPVTVTLKGTSAEPQRLSATIERIDPGQSASVKVSLKDVPTFGEVLQACVEVGAVAGEKNLENNAMCYPVLFRL